MGKKVANRYFNLRNLFLILFVLVALGDVISTLLVKWKHPIFNETTPAYVLGNINIYVLFGISLVTAAYLFWLMVWHYQKINRQTARYILIYFIVLVTFIKLGVVIANFGVLSIPSDQIVEYPDEVKVQYYKEQVGDMKAIQNITPNTGYQMPLMFTMFFINLLQFLIWRSFEEHGWRAKNERTACNHINIDGLGILEK